MAKRVKTQLGGGLMALLWRLGPASFKSDQQVLIILSRETMAGAGCLDS